MPPQFDTRRVNRTWLEKLLLWGSAYETKIFAGHYEVIGRGSSPDASQQIALEKWNAEIRADQESGSFRREC